MVIALLIIVLYVFFIWLVFFKLRLLQFSIAWGVVSVIVGLHLLLIFLIGLRFVTPYSTDAKIIQHTIQLVPRLSEPTLVTAVLVEPNVPVKKGQPLFQFDRRPYEYQVEQLQAQLAQARQNVGVLKADVEIAEQEVAKARSGREYAQYQQQLEQGLAREEAVREVNAQKWDAQLKIADAAISRVGWAWPTFSFEPRLEWWAMPTLQDYKTFQRKTPSRRASVGSGLKRVIGQNGDRPRFLVSSASHIREEAAAVRRPVVASLAGPASLSMCAAPASVSASPPSHATDRASIAENVVCPRFP